MQLDDDGGDSNASNASNVNKASFYMPYVGFPVAPNDGLTRIINAWKPNG